MLAILAPGQGAQSAGFVDPWLQRPSYGDRLRELLEEAGACAVTRLLDDLPRSEPGELVRRMRDTAVLQPLLVTVGLAAAELLPDLPSRAGAVAGHSVGGLTALALAGVLDPVAATGLALMRGRAMSQAAGTVTTGMTAATGDPMSLEALAEQWGPQGARVAVRNSPRQLVLAGPAATLEALALSRPTGVRTVRLEVAGAFHTDHMEPAAAALGSAVDRLTARDPSPPVVSDLDGAVLSSGAELLARLPRQVVHPVRWDLCQRTLRELRVTGVLELPPAGTLAAMARRHLPGVERFALDSPDRLAPASRFVERHA